MTDRRDLSDKDISPLRFLGGLVVFDAGALDGLSATGCRELGRLRRKAVEANRAGDMDRLLVLVDRMRRVVADDGVRRERAERELARRLEMRRREDRRVRRRFERLAERKSRSREAAACEVRTGVLPS